MEEQITHIQQVLDAAVKQGVLGDLQSAGIVAISWNRIQEALKELETIKKTKDATDNKS